MKNNKYLKPNFLFLLGLVLIFTNCSRDRSEEAELATFPKNGEVYIDGFSSGLEYLPFGDSYLQAFSVDEDTKYDGTSAMRFDVPNVGDPNGAYSGAIFPDYGGRDLSEFDALTFWARASQTGTINELGFGQDFREAKYLVTFNNLQLNTNWRKYIIAIPDASKLTREFGLFWYAEGPEDEEGYTFWIDELQFEKLGTIAQARPAIYNGEDTPVQTSVNLTTKIAGLTQTYNLGNGGVDQTVTAAPGYFEFTSSDPSVATVDELGVITGVSTGDAIITATLGGVEAAGSARVSVGGVFNFAPTPTQDPSDVISIFSDAYTNEPVDYFNGYWLGSATQGQDDINIAGDNIIAYTDLDFVGIQFADNVPNINGSAMTHLHLDIQPREDVDASDFIRIEVVDAGADSQLGTGDDSAGSFTISGSSLMNEEWYSADIPMADFGLANQANLAQVIFVSDATIANIYVDNIYFYDDGNGGGTGGGEEPTMASPSPGQSAADVISLFSNAYTNVGVDTWRTEWSAATLEDVQIAGDDTKKYTGFSFVGVETTGGNLIDASAMTHFRVDVWTPNLTTFKIKLVDFGADGAFDGGDDTEHELVFENPTQGEWVSYDIPLSDFTGLMNTSNMAQFIFAGEPAGTGTVFIDNVYFYKTGGSGGDEPTVAAATPTQDAANVISLFSNAYTNVAVDTWRTDWSMADLEDIQVAGDDTKKYTNLDFVGVETVGGNLIDASSMTHFRVDIWTPNMTTIRIKLVDFGPDGGFDGGDDTEHELVFENPAQGQWVSYDIPLSDFTGLTTTSSMAQFIFSGLPAGGGTLFVDNVYFYKQ